MPAMNAGDRSEVAVSFGRDLSSVREPLGSVTKADIRAAVDALDDLLVANAGAINSAIPQPARGALTTAQKARLLSAVVLRRYASGA